MTSPRLDYGIHCDVDSDRFLHSDDPASDDWVVEVLEGGVWQPQGRTTDWMSPSLRYRPVRNAWCIDMRWRVRQPATRVIEQDGTVTVVVHPTEESDS